MGEIDESPVLGPKMANYFQCQIGILRWCVELGRIDIITEVSMLSTFLFMPRECHLDVVYHLFAYLSLYHNARVVFDPTYPDIDMRAFIKTDWKPVYGDVKEAIPPNAPVARGKAIDLRLFVDSDHAEEQFMHRSRTGFVIYLNMAPFVWFSKRQPTVDSSVFGAEFVSMKNGIETTGGLRYKLRMMGVTIYGPTYVYGDNMSVVHNTHRPETVLKKKSNAIWDHAVRESVVMGSQALPMFLLWTTLLISAPRLCQVVRSVITWLDYCCMTLFIEHLIILLAEEVCGSWGFPGCMGSQIHNQMLVFSGHPTATLFVSLVWGDWRKASVVMRMRAWVCEGVWSRYSSYF
jgi:hypothetical protein